MATFTGIRIPVRDKDKFVKFHMCKCITNLESRYMDKFPENIKLIKESIINEVNRQGREVFTGNPHTQLLCTLLELITLRK